MKYLLFLLLLASPSLAKSSSPHVELIDGDEICSLVEYELKEAVKFDLITEREASDILIRCFINYS